MGAGARRRSVRRQVEDAKEAADAARFWLDLAKKWEGPQRGRTVEATADAQWARSMADAARSEMLAKLNVQPSLPTLDRLARARVELDALMAQCVAHLRDTGTSWALIASCVGLTAEGARRRWGPK